HGQTARIPADNGAARGAEGGWCNQRLDFDEQGPRAFDPSENGRSWRRRVTVAKEQLGWVRDLPQPLSGHLEHADLVGGAEPVLDSSQDTERVAAVPLEVEDRVDHVLDHLGSGDLALFGDMADEHQCAALRFGEANQRLRCGANLAYGAGGCFERLGPKRLDGIDDDQIGPPTLGKR